MVGGVRTHSTDHQLHALLSTSIDLAPVPMLCWLVALPSDSASQIVCCLHQFNALVPLCGHNRLCSCSLSVHMKGMAHMPIVMSVWY